MLLAQWSGLALSAFSHPKLGHHVPQTVQEATECAGWLNGSLDSYHDAYTRSWSPGGFTSQFRQDKILYKTLFHNRTKRGIYLDIASNHYKRISNSYFYDRCLGWQGVCVEPNPIYHDELQRLRSCELLPTCASSSTAEVELTLPTNPWIGALGGINGGRMREYEKQISHKERGSVAKRLRCVRVGDELSRLGVRHVDLFSLDVEGHERAVLDGIDPCRHGLRLDPARVRSPPRPLVASPSASPVCAAWPSGTSYARPTAPKCSAAGVTQPASRAGC
jgi:FkbM family methyltransferase